MYEPTRHQLVIGQAPLSLSSNSTGACFHHNQLSLASAEGTTACGENLPHGGFGTSSTVTEPPDKGIETGNAFEAEPVGPFDSEPPAHQLLFHQVADCFACTIR
jgi:hypothetical protein